MSTENYRLRNGKVIDSNGLEQLELEGLSEDAIADRYDISKSYLLRLRKRYGWKRKHSKPKVKIINLSGKTWWTALELLGFLLSGSN